MLRGPEPAARARTPPEAGDGGGATPPNDGFFDTAATWVGAMGDEDWTAGWTAFPAD